MLRYSQLNTKVKMHLDPFDCVIKTLTLDAAYFQGIASRLRSVSSVKGSEDIMSPPISLTVFIMDAKWEDVRVSSVYHYLIAMCESLRIKLIIQLKTSKRRTLSSATLGNKKYVLDYKTYGYQAKLQELVDHFNK